MRDDVLDAGLGLAMEWGEQWLHPIQDRLHQQHPELNRSDLDAYDAACRSAMRTGHELVKACWHEADGDQAQARALFAVRMRAVAPWASERNLGHLFSQGCYYAWKDGGLP